MVTNTIIFLAKLSSERFTKFWTSIDLSWFSGHDTPLFFLFFENLKTFVYIFSKFKNSWNWELWNRHPKANRQNRWRLIRKVRQLLFDCQFRIPKLRTQSTQSVHTVSFDWFLSGLEWILNLEFCSLKLFIFYQKLFFSLNT